MLRAQPNRAKRIFPLLITVLLLSSSSFLFIQAQGAVTIVNESSYPWLAQGAYADYVGLNGEAPAFVLQNGTVLLGVQPPGSTLPQSTANITLDWMVLNRTADMAWLSISFHIAGCEYSETEFKDDGNCTSFNFSHTQVVLVNVTDGESYINGQSQGRLSLWAPPLLVGGEVYSGTAFVNGTAHDSLSNVTAYPSMNLGIPITTPNGVVTGPYDVYQLIPTLFGFNGTKSTFAWENVTLAGNNGGKLITVFPISTPSGLYDYYNGLGIEISLPQYPINETVCDLGHGQVTDCQVTTYATTLGNFFRSASTTLALTSTNVPIGASQPGSSTTDVSTTNATTDQAQPKSVNETTLIAALAIVASVATISGIYLLRSRKSRRGTASRRDRRRSIARPT